MPPPAGVYLYLKNLLDSDVFKEIDFIAAKGDDADNEPYIKFCVTHKQIIHTHYNDSNDSKPNDFNIDNYLLFVLYTLNKSGNADGTIKKYEIWCNVKTGKFMFKMSDKYTYYKSINKILYDLMFELFGWSLKRQH